MYNLYLYSIHLFPFSLMHSCRTSKTPVLLIAPPLPNHQLRSHLQESLPSRLTMKQKQGARFTMHLPAVPMYTSLYLGLPTVSVYVRATSHGTCHSARLHRAALPARLSDILHTTYDIRHITPARAASPSRVLRTEIHLTQYLHSHSHPHLHLSSSSYRESFTPKFPRFPPSTTSPCARQRDMHMHVLSRAIIYRYVYVLVVSNMYSVACMYSYLMYARTRHVCHRRLAPQLLFYMHLIPGSRVSPCKSCPTSTSPSITFTKYHFTLQQSKRSS
ncbi:hypothetical protein J3E69DRAFT_336776 [Trichoderma sp. SZMC 28015]